MVVIYRISLLLAVFVLAGAAVFVASNLASLAPGMGDGGAFLAVLSLGAVLLALIIATPLAWFAACVSFVWQDAMPEGRFYNYWMPVIVALPGTSLLVVAWLGI